jgi:excisionase family DNA binding protein
MGVVKMEGKTVKEAAKLLGVSRCRIENLLRERRLWGYKWNRDWVVSVEGIANYQQTRRKYTKKPPMIHAQNTEIQDIQLEESNGARSNN